MFKLKNIIHGFEASLLAVVLVAIGAALMETLHASGGNLSGESLGNVYHYAVFVIFIPFAAIGVGLGFASAAMLRGRPVESLWPGWLGDNTHSGAARILVWGIAVYVVFVLLHPLHARVTFMFVNDFKNKEVSGWFLNIFEYGLLFVAIATSVLIASIIRKPVLALVGKIQQHVSHRVVFFSVLALIALVSFVLLSNLVATALEPFEELDRRGMQTMYHVMWVLVAVWMLCLAMPRLKGLPANIVLRVLIYGYVLFIGYQGIHMDKDNDALGVLNNEGLVFRSLSPIVLKYNDIDHDRYSSFMGGTDQAPFDPWAYPGAPEIPDNGKDDNCMLGDAPKGFVPDIKHEYVEPPTSLKQGPFNILFITMDAVRADHLSCYGYKRKTTPYIDTIARQGAIFANNYSQGPGTILSIPSFMGGKYISQMVCLNLQSQPGSHRLVPETETIADYLRSKGYMTIGVGGHGYLAMVDSQEWNIFSNPKDKQVGPNKISNPEINERAIGLIKKYVPTNKTFMWVHYYDPHDKYLSHPDNPVNFGKSKVDLYDGEILNTDMHIKTLVETWQKNSSIPTVIIIASDHGESLGEHGITHHGTHLYRSIVHVPLIINVPGVKGGHVIQSPSSLVDIAPTIRNMLGDSPVADQFGHSLLGPVVTGKPQKDRAIFQEMQFEVAKKYYSKRGILTDRYHLIWDLQSGVEELFDLKKDPRELTNIASTEPVALKDMRSLLQRRMEDVSVTMPRLNYCNYRPPKDRNYYPPASEELIEPWLHDTLPKGVKKVDIELVPGYVRMVGVKMTPRKLAANKKVTVRMFFRQEQPSTDNYRLFFHLRGTGGKKSPWGGYSLNYDHYPVANALPVPQWPSDKIVEDSFTFQIPNGRGKGTIDVWTGFYLKNQGRIEIKVHKGGMKATRHGLLLGKLKITKDILHGDKVSAPRAISPDGAAAPPPKDSSGKIKESSSAQK